MGDLVRTPHSEITATLEVLDKYGVNSRHLSQFRGASNHIQRMVAQAIILCREDFFAEKTYYSDFFVTRSGLHVWGSFNGLVLSEVSGEAVPATLGKVYDLSETMTEAEIRENLGEDHVFEDTSRFCAMLAQMIEHQWGGKEGDLLANGHANLFFLRVGSEVVVVDISWYSARGRWDVGAYRFGADDRWPRGSRAFSAA